MYDWGNLRYDLGALTSKPIWLFDLFPVESVSTFLGGRVPDPDAAKEARKTSWKRVTSTGLPTCTQRRLALTLSLLHALRAIKRGIAAKNQQCSPMQTRDGPPSLSSQSLAIPTDAARASSETKIERGYAAHILVRTCTTHSFVSGLLILSYR